MMSDLNKVTCLSPDKRVQSILHFLNQLTQNERVRDNMHRWGLDFAQDMVSFQGRVLPVEKIFQRDRSYMYNQDEADWSREVRSEFPAFWNITTGTRNVHSL